MTRIMAFWMVLFVLPVCAAATPQRIVSIGGSVTEIIYQLNEQDRLVGNDTTSYYPVEAESLPKVGYQRALSAEGILSLAPDLVVCTTEAGPPAVLEQLKTAGVQLLVLDADFNIKSITRKITKIAQVLNVSVRGQSLIQAIEDQVLVLKRKASEHSTPHKVMFILQHGGGAPMVAGKGTAANSIIALSGAQNVVTDFDGYKPLTPEAAVLLNPEIILITSQGLEQAGGKNSLINAPGIALTEAAKEGRVIAMDSLLMLGFGPRTVEAALELNRRYKGL